MITQPFFEHACEKCGVIDEARFLHAGPHIKQVCNNCEAYVKFFPEHTIPDVEYIKQKIWNIVDGDQVKITEMKVDTEFVEGLTGKYAKLMYWNLYLNIRSAQALGKYNQAPAPEPVKNSQPENPSWL